jgi:ABC-type nitrate/sulfonate/bicarbonate transport system permease component
MTQGNPAVADSARAGVAALLMRGVHAILYIYPIVLVLLIWEVFSRVGIFDPFFVPPFSEVLATLYDQLFVSGDILVHTLASLRRISIGYAIAAVVGVSMGLAMGRITWIRNFFDPLIAAIYPTPKLALLPLMMALLGIGDASKITLIAIAAFFPIVLSTFAGVKDIDHFLIWNARTKGANSFQVLRTVILPASMPYIFTGLRIALAHAFLLIVASELISANEGLGFLIMFAERNLNQTLMFSGILMIALIGFAATQTLQIIGQRLFIWQKHEEE